MITIKDTRIADCGYYINLDHRIDRKENIENQLLQNNICGVIRHEANKTSDSGPQNCKYSHYELYKKFLQDSNGEVLLVLEDDCLFLPYLIDNIKEISDNIYSNDFDVFWLGCRNRRTPRLIKNKCYRVQSVSHAQSYLINRKLCQYLIDNFPENGHNGLAIDELLCLVAYGYDVCMDPNKYGFYQMDDPMDDLPIFYNGLCYERALTTQYQSFSDLWQNYCNYEDYIISSYPVV